MLTQPSPKPYSDQEIAARGDEIYESEIRARVEGAHHGRIVAIDVRSGAYVVGDNALDASERLLKDHPAAEIWCVRVGHRALQHVGTRSVLRVA